MKIFSEIGLGQIFLVWQFKHSIWKPNFYFWFNFTIQTKSQQKSKTFVCSDDVETKQNHWEIYRMNKQKTVWIWNKWIICFWKFYIKTKWAKQIFFLYIWKDTCSIFLFNRLADNCLIIIYILSQFNLKKFEILFLYYLLHKIYLKTLLFISSTHKCLTNRGLNVFLHNKGQFNIIILSIVK